MEEFNETKLAYRNDFEDGFSVCVDEDGIIWYRHSPNEEFDRPCMKLCYDVTKLKDKDVAKYILALSCSIQDNDAVTLRALRHYNLE